MGVDLGATSLDVAVLRPDLTVLARHTETTNVRSGPGVVLARLRVLMRQLLDPMRRDRQTGDCHWHGRARPGGL